MGELLGGETRVLAAVGVLVCALSIAGCEGTDEGRSGEGDTGPIEVTLASVGTAEEEADKGGGAGVLLRVEGDTGTLFSGVCSVGDERSVISGQVPGRFAYEVADGALEGDPFSCRIQKQDEGEGSLKVILLAGDATRSVQQTKEKGDTLDVSYTGSQTA